MGGGGFQEEVLPNVVFAQMDAVISWLLFESFDCRSVPHLTFMHNKEHVFTTGWQKKSAFRNGWNEGSDTEHFRNAKLFTESACRRIQPASSKENAKSQQDLIRGTGKICTGKGLYLP